MGGAGRVVLTLSLSSSLLNLSRFSANGRRLTKLPTTSRLFPPPFRTLCSASAAAAPTAAEPEPSLQPMKHSMLLERLRMRTLKDSTPQPKTRESSSNTEPSLAAINSDKSNKKGKVKLVETFEELGLNEEVMGAVREMRIEVPTEIQCTGIPSVLEGKSVVLGSHTGSGKTLAYLLPLVQLLRRDEAMYGMLMKPRRPRAVVLCPTRELTEQVFRVAKSISHHARFRSTIVSGGTRIRPQEDSLNNPVDLVVGTPGRVLQHIQEGNMVYGDIRYVVLDEADTMFDHGFGPDIRKFLSPLKNRVSKTDAKEFQTILVTATMTKAVQKLVDEEFQGILHLRTSSLHKKISTARHDFIKLSGSENKLESLLQVLEPSLARGNKVMVFCNTLNSSRAVDHFLGESQISTVNYHGEVPAEKRVENLEKFKKEEGDCPTLVCTDLAARGLDLDVDHVIMFDFPLNSIDYLHRTGRTARMGAKGKVTSLVAKKDLLLATRIEEAMRKNESLEALSAGSIHRDIARAKISDQKDANAKKISKASDSRNKVKSKVATGSTPRSTHAKVTTTSKTSARKSPSTKPRAKVPTISKASERKSPSTKPAKTPAPAKSGKTFRISNVVKSNSGRKSTEPSSASKATTATTTKLRVVGFRGRNSSSIGKRAVGS
ncbi:hypothetical protein SAY86_004366 [Trapa natans]|uniref:DEAD-box ATP-dependent RNA helicase 39 n=1 Tax=Trapa natans TaxID=22666 RepID=A0AAN7MFH8_TRANT|nr:hypothetical protein SAY86_004366 [Trapa natans]